MKTSEKLEKLIEMVDSADKLDPGDEVEALELSLSKWHPSRKENRGTSIGKYSCRSCGLCVFFRLECSKCCMFVDGMECDDDGHVYERWNIETSNAGHHKGAKYNNKYAHKIYEIILSRYIELGCDTSWLEWEE